MIYQLRNDSDTKNGLPSSAFINYFYTKSFDIILFHIYI